MNPVFPSRVTLLAVAMTPALLLNAGCTTNNRSHPAGPMVYQQPVETMPARIELNDAMTVDPTPGTPEPSARVDLNEAPYNNPDSIRFTRASDDTLDRPNTSVISAFGELVSNTSHTLERPSDGADNLFRITNATEGAIFDPHVNREGTQIVFASTMHSEAADLYRKSTTGSTITKLTDDPAHDLMPSFSPDGSRIAFASDRAGDWNIYFMSADGGRPIQLTSDRDQELHPTWSPDGRTLAYCKFNAQSARWEIWTVDINNPGVRNFLVYGLFPEWNPDPARPKLLFQRARQRGSRYHSVWTVDVVGGEAKYETEIVSAANAATINPSWSPDGSRIVFVTVVDPELEMGDRPHQSDVWIIDTEGGSRMNLTTGEFSNFQPVWARNGNVYFISDRSGVDNIWAVSTGMTMPLPDDRPMDIVQVNPDNDS